jgi:NAD(P)-dependent dehydrogenase (short-subunit alcohol dehydrogenase family)
VASHYHSPTGDSYAGKRVLVGGCASGIGAATATGAAAWGATVTGCDIATPSAPVDAFVQVDLGDRDSVDQAAAKLTDPFDAVFLCSGVSAGKGLTPLELITINFIGTRALLEQLTPNLTAGASIALIGSLSAVDVLVHWDMLGEFLALDDWGDAAQWCERHEQVLTRSGCYPFSKEAIVAYTMRSAYQLARRGIRINCISPAPVLTPFLRDTMKTPGAKELLAAFPIPLGRHSEASEQANVLLFLGSDAASFITGQNLWTDGGYTAAVAAGDVRPVLGQSARD